MKRAAFAGIVVGLAVLVGASLVLLARRGGPAAPGAAATTRYHCPMHPTYVSDKPGDCLICGMRLVPRGTTTPGRRRVLYYRSPMDPNVRSETPAKDAMGMDFIPVYADELGGRGPTVSGRAVVTLTPERRQILGVRTERVQRQRLVRVIRTVGRVAVDERRLHHIHTKYDGYVEHLHVDFTGKFVKRGEPLLSIYSPELVATQQEYLLAYRAQKQMGQSGIPSVAQGSLDLLEAARQRLLLWDIRPADIETLEETDQVTRTLDLHSDVSGYVVQKMAFHGMRVTPADTLFDIADLSRVWVLADVYESDLPLVRIGMVGELTVPYLPARKWRGPVTYVNPTVEEKTRTVKVRLELENQGQALKPDMFADVFLRADLGAGLVVPEDAVVDSGGRKLVFLDEGEGRFEPREVQLGVKAGSGFQVLSGLAEGDLVVTSANFLLDSESSLRAALSAMGTPEPSAPAHAH
jgi:multidrug efflux pump subunit AcrA (membrane-fusion protein)